MIAMFLALALTTSAEAGLFADNWMPDNAVCPLDQRALRDVIQTKVHECRMQAGYADRASGVAFDWYEVVACMEDEGWVRSRRPEKKTWLAQCPAPMDVRSERRVAAAHRSAAR